MLAVYSITHVYVSTEATKCIILSEVIGIQPRFVCAGNQLRSSRRTVSAPNPQVNSPAWSNVVLNEFQYFSLVL